MRRPYFKAPLTLEELTLWNDILDDELRMRLQLAFASQSPMTGFGIVAAEDPTTATVTSGSPLGVSVNAGNPTLFDVNAGSVVFPNGEIVPLNEVMQGISLANTAGNAKNVVYLYFVEQDSEETALTRAQVLTPIRVEYLDEPIGYVQSLTLADYLTLPQSTLLRVVPLAVVSVEITDTGNTLVIDMGTTVLPTNRPWFTAVDLKHRSQVGTGAVTATNPHGTSLNDLGVGNGKTLFQLLLDYGMVVGKDIGMAKVPGTVCTETVLAGAVQTDVTGAITGVVNAKYMRLSRFPRVILGATNTGKTKDYGLAWVPGTPIVFFNPLEPWDGGNVVVYYSAVAAAEPPTPVNPISLPLTQPLSSDETMVAGGIVVTELAQPTLTFEDAGQIASLYSVYVDNTGAVQRYPKTLVCQAKLATIGGVIQSFTLPFLGPAKIKVGLTKATPGATLAVNVQIKGKAINGATLTDTVSFGAGWAEPTLPFCGELDTQFLRTTNVYASVESYTVLSSANTGPIAEISMWSDADPVTTPDLADVLPVADVTWDGFKVCSLRDTRPIGTKLEDPTASKFSDGAKAIAELTPVLLGPPSYTFAHWTEDFNQPQYIGLQYLEPSPTVDEPPFTMTAMQKTVDGLGPRSVYVSRAVPVKPHTSAPKAIRFVPIDPGRGFTVWIRVMMSSAVWSEWYRSSNIVDPLYTLPLGGLGLGGAPLLKWQVAVTGDCKGYVMTYLTSTVPDSSGLLYWDVGAWDEGAYG